jgi:hypothetical protein
MWKKKRFSTGGVEGNFAPGFSTGNLSTFHRPCGEKFECKIQNAECRIADTDCTLHSAFINSC